MLRYVFLFVVAAMLAAGPGFAAESLERTVDGAFAHRWKLCYSPKTSLLYGCAVEKVKKADKFKDGIFDWYKGIPGGYGEGMGDCALIDGVALSGCVDRWEALSRLGYGPDDPEMLKTAEWAAGLAQGLLNLTSRHRFKGFVARGLCEEDGTSICSLSSIDQHTHWAHGLWRYFRSPMAREEIVREMKVRFAEVAGRMERTVIPENDYNFGLCDGRPDPRGICRMWWDKPSTGAGRLASIYAAAYDVTKDPHWKEMYEKYADFACAGAARLEDEKAANPKWKWVTPAYTLLQNASAWEVLLGCEKDPKRREPVLTGLSMGAKEADFRAKDMWNNPKKQWYGMCTDGELALAQLMAPRWDYDETERAILVKAIRRYDRNSWDTCRTAHLFAAYWRAVVRGIVKPGSRYCEKAPFYLPPPLEDRGGNLVFNSSFELGFAPAGWRATVPFPEKASDRPTVTVDETQAAHGRRSLKVTCPVPNAVAEILLPAARFVPNTGSNAVFAAALQMRADRPVGMGVTFSSAGIDETTGAMRRTDLWHGAKVTKANEWRRFTFENLAFPGTEGSVTIRLRVHDACTVWIDAVQFEKGKGKAGAYAPRADVEAAFTADEKLIVAKDDGTTRFPVDFRAVSYAPAATSVVFTTSLGPQNLTLEPLKPVVRTIRPGAKRFGVLTFGGFFDLGEKKEYVFPLDFAVVPEVPARTDGFFLGTNGGLGLTAGVDGKGGFVSTGDRTFAGTVRDFRRAGFTSIRIHDAGCDPDGLYPAPGKADFSRLDSLVDALRENGVEPLFVFGSTAQFINRRWGDAKFTNWYFRVNSKVAAGGPMKGRTYFLPKDEDWRDTIAATVKHFRGRIRRYEIVNEPNITVASAEDYLHYQKIAYETIKSIDPAATVVGICSTGDFGANSGKFVERAGELGAFKYLDEVSFHPYDAPVDNPLADAEAGIAEIRATCDKFRKGVPILEDELYYVTWPSQHQGMRAGLSDASQGRWWPDGHLVRRYAIDLAGGAVGSTPLSGFDQLACCDAANRGLDFSRSFAGAFVPNGRFVASAAFAKYLCGARFKGKPKLADGLNGFVFTDRDGHEVTLVWARRFGATIKYAVPAGATVRDLYGNALEGAEIAVSANPIYVFSK